jgi:hypothetical protein
LSIGSVCLLGESFCRPRMNSILPAFSSNRREFARRLALASAFFAVPGAFAEALTQTPRQTEGPFYPDHLPLDTDNDLLAINDATTPAVGDVTYVSGRILGPNGSPIRNATVEIWQCDANGAYLHPKSGTLDGATRVSKGSAGSSRAARVSTCFARSNPSPTPDVRRTFTSRSSEAGRIC